MMKLRPYQTKTVNDLYRFFKDGPKPLDSLIHIPTAGGKTEIAMDFMEKVLAENKTCCFIVRRRHLVEQTYLRIKRRFPKKGIGLLMAEKSNFDFLNTSGNLFGRKDLDIIVCSIDTLIRRVVQFSFIKQIASVYIMDEAHDTTSKSYQDILKQIKTRDNMLVGLTATPYKVNGKYHHFWTKENLLSPVTPYELLEQGYLCPIRFFSPPTDILYKNLKKQSSTGDYTAKSLYQEVNKKHIYGDYKTYFEKYGLGKNTITFCVNVDHSHNIERTLKESGVKNILRIDCYLDRKSQNKIKKDIEKFILLGENFHLVNVNMFSTGIDIPELDVGFMLRPTASVVLWDQQCGRLTRVSPGKNMATVLDFTKNTHNHSNMFQTAREAELDGPSSNKLMKKTKICPQCFYLAKIYLKVCPECGFEFGSDKTPQSLSTVKANLKKVFDYSEPEYRNLVKSNLKKIKIRAMEKMF